MEQQSGDTDDASPTLDTAEPAAPTAAPIAAPAQPAGGDSLIGDLLSMDLGPKVAPTFAQPTFQPQPAFQPQAPVQPVLPVQPAGKWLCYSVFLFRRLCYV